jgi:hypothetical protein
MVSTWYVGFSALMMALKSCSTLVGGKRRKFDGESIKSQTFCLILCWIRFRTLKNLKKIHLGRKEGQGAKIRFFHNSKSLREVY